MLRVGAAVVLVGLLTLVPDRVDAQSTPGRTPVAPRAGESVGGALLSIGLGLTLYLIPNPPMTTPLWRGGVLLDDPVRDALRLRSADDRRVADTISDVAVVSTMALAVGVDALFVPLVQGDTNLAWEAETAWAMATGLTLFVGEMIKRGTGRARPSELGCSSEPGGCSDANRYESFFSLHAAVAFAAAGTSCALHLSRGLYGDVATDAIACSVSLAMALTTGLLRIAADAHWLSDVLVGSAIGLLAGFLATVLIVPPRGPSVGATPAPLLQSVEAVAPAMPVGVSMTFDF